MKQAVNVNCPVCQTSAIQEVETSINAQTEPKLKKELLDGTLQRFECAHCGAKRQIETQFLYHDPVKKFMVFLLPNFSQREEQLTDILEGIKRDHHVNYDQYELRIVVRQADLVEKIQLFDLNYNDREVEIVKLLTDGLFAKEKPDAQVKARYFYLKNGIPKIIYLTDKDQLLVDFNQSLLDFARDKYKKVVSKPAKGEFHLINAEWAAHALSS